jgi:hypothetical protein
MKPAYIVHSLPRRVHLRAPPLAAHPEACRRIAERLAEEPGAHDMVSVRVSTGSVVLVSKERDLDPEALLGRLNELVRAEHDENGTPLADLPHAPPGPTNIARSVARAFSHLNADVRTHLHHRADLAALVPVVFATLGLVQIAVTRKMPAPAWFNLLWWSLRSFLSFNMVAIAEEPRAGGGP